MSNVKLCRRMLLMVVGVLLLAVGMRAQVLPQPAPLPAKLMGKTIFLSNAGADSGLFPSPFSGAPSRAYDYLYAALKRDGTYVLVNDPAQADLVFEIRVTAPSGPQSPSKVNGASDPLPMARLVIYDRPTHYILWADTQSVEVALLQKTHDANFDRALDRLLSDLKSVVGPKS
ncbi:MAG TPA: hypothetical protein VK814_14070 [Acidobacteriaceae bacterium]|jgi:hypothetical protein|nr:hypothetical protein [Acidobacteriaceae bacterium]